MVIFIILSFSFVSLGSSYHEKDYFPLNYDRLVGQCSTKYSSKMHLVCKYTSLLYTTGLSNLPPSTIVSHRIKIYNSYNVLNTLRVNTSCRIR